MAYHERWFEGPKQRILSQVHEMVPPPPGAIMEVGAWEGKSTISTARYFPDEQIHVVDHWLGDFSPIGYKTGEAAAARDVYADFEENCREAGVFDRMVIHRGDWREAFVGWTEPIRFIFIDAEHTYREVLENIQVALPFMVPGGIIAGDDHTVPEVAAACKDALGQVDHVSGPGAAIWWWKVPA